jgi:hypothetical protein
MLHIPIHVINLDRRPDRWRAMHWLAEHAMFHPADSTLPESVLALIGAYAGTPDFSLHRAPAVDAARLAAKPDVVPLPLRSANARPGEKACFLTHLALWRARAADDRREPYLVMEDDAICAPRWASITRLHAERMTSEPSLGILWIGYLLPASEPVRWDVMLREEAQRATYERPVAPSPHSHLDQAARIGVTHAYLLSQAGAIALLAQWAAVERGDEPLLHPAVDRWLLREARVRQRAVFSPVFLSPYPSADSDIQPRSAEHAHAHAHAPAPAPAHTQNHPPGCPHHHPNCPHRQSAPAPQPAQVPSQTPAHR